MTHDMRKQVYARGTKWDGLSGQVFVFLKLYALLLLYFHLVQDVVG